MQLTRVSSLLTLSAILSAFCAQAQSVKAVLNGASFTTTVAPGTWVAIFGTQLAPGPMAASSVPFPTQLNGVSIKVGGVAAPLSYVSETQNNALIPFEAAALASAQQITVPLVVSTPSGALPAFSLVLHRDAPGIYTKNQMGTGDALAFDANFNAVTNVGRDAILLYATGLGPTDPPANSGSLGANTEPLNRSLDIGAVVIGGRPAKVLYAGLAPGLQGIYQLNVVPDPLAGSDLVVTAGAMISKAVTLPVPAGLNVTNVVGSIKGLYPAAAQFGGSATNKPVTFSALLTAASLSVDFDIVPSAKPFKIVASTTYFRAEIDIDPPHNKWTATYPGPTVATRSWDFSGSEFVVQDFSNGVPFPGNIIPSSRLDPMAQQALTLLPLPNNPSAGTATGMYTSSGTLSPAGHFAIDSAFGGFKNVVSVPGTSTIIYQLYIDNLLVASQSATYGFIE